MFWPDLSDTAAATNLRTSLYRMRQPIEDVSPALAKGFLTANRQTVALNSASFHCDVQQFETLLETCKNHAHHDLAHCDTCLAQLAQAVALYQDDLLAGFHVDEAPAFEEWLTVRREGLRQKLQETLHQLALAYENRADDVAQDYARRLLQLEPWREDAHRLLMRVAVRHGQTNLALAQYQICRQVLASELSIEPDAETVALFEQIRNGALKQPAFTNPTRTRRKAPAASARLAALAQPASTALLDAPSPSAYTLNLPPTPSPATSPSPTPPTPSPQAASAPQHNLPIPLTSLVGRENELARVKELLTTQRLITLIGPGGTGKTRLSLEVGRDLLAQFADGIWQIELASLTDAEWIVPTVTTALGLRESQTGRVDDALISYLRSKSLLMILDNCEHMVQACAALAQRILQACPRVQILATSREALHLSGETILPLQPLAVPDPITALTSNTITEVLQYDAIRLFIDRIRSVQPYFQLTVQNVDSVLQICRQLDGIPLALELAAARARSLPLDEMLPRLDQRLTLLKGVHEHTNPRHQTLRATIDWGYDLLSPSEQRLFRQLAVFSGSFTLAAVEYLAEGNLEGNLAATHPSSILDLLTSLVDKSFVLMDRGNDATGTRPIHTGHTGSGVGRYRLLETMRLYALDCLAHSADELPAYLRHLDFYTQLAEEAMSYSRSPDMPHWFRRLDAEQDNLRAALAWALDPTHGQAVAAMRLAGTLGRHWEVRGHLLEAQNAMKQVFALNPASILNHKQETLGSIDLDLNDATARQVAMWRARALVSLSFVPHLSAEFEAARQCLFEAIAISQALQDGFNIAQTYNTLGILADDQADYAQAQHYYEASHTLFREQDSHWGMALTLNNLASISVAQGNAQAAWPLIQESVALMRTVGDPGRLANLLGTLAQTSQELGNFELARQALNEAASIHRDLGDQLRNAELLNDMGDFESRQRRFSEARRLYVDGIAILQKIWDRRRLAITLEGLGRTLVALGDLPRAVRLFANADALRAIIGSPISPAQKLARDAALATAEHILGQVNFAKAWSAGHTMSLEQAIADAGNVQSPLPTTPDGIADANHTLPLAFPLTAQDRYDWGAMPAIEVFHGRSVELVQLQGWLLQDQCRFVSILGLGGIGKTTLAAATAKAVAPAFDGVIWRSLLNAPPVEEMIHDWLQTLSQYTLDVMPESLDAGLRLLLDYLRQQRCLLILDNGESLFKPSPPETQSVGYMRPEYAGYAQLFERLAASEHKSCLLLTSREQPNALIRVGRENHAVRQMQLGGLDLQAGSAILHGSGLSTSAQDAALLVKQYSGNPLALQIVANTITDLFDGDVAYFQRQGGLVFDGIRAVLDQQYERLSNLEREILIWLAIEREAISAQELRQNFVESVSMAGFLGALGALQARSLLERTESGLTLQNVVIDYLTERLIDDICAEINTSAVLNKDTRLHRHAILKAQAKDYIRQSQMSLIIGGIGARLSATLGKPNLTQRLRAMLSDLRQHFMQQPTYAVGNLLNLLLYLEADLDNCDLSGLYVWQAYLRTAKLQNVNLSGADLRGTVFADTFASITHLAYSRDGQYVAGATSIGDIRVWSASTLQPVGSLQGHSRLVMGLAFSANDSHLLASGSEDGTVRLWDLADLARPSTLLYQAQGFVRTLALSPRANLIAIAGDEVDIQIWDVRAHRAIAVLRGHTNIITSLAFTPDGKFLASCSGDHTVRMWPVEALYSANTPANSAITLSNSTVIYTWPTEMEDVWAIAISPNGQRLAGVNRDGKAWTWQIDETLSDKPIHVLRERDVHHATLAFSADSTMLAVGAESRAIWLFDVQTGKTIRQLEGHRNLTTTLAYAPDGQTLVSSGSDRILKVWDLHTGRLVQAMAGAARTVRCVAYGADGRTLVSCGADRVTRIWELSESCDDNGHIQLTGKCQHILQGGHSSGIWAVAIDRSSQVVASTGEDHNICLWDRATGRLLHTLHGHSYTVTAIDFSADGRTLASASPDQTVRLWDYRSGMLLNTLTSDSPSHSVHEHSIWCVAVSPHGDLVAAGYSNGNIALWDIRDVKQAKPVRELRRHAGWVRHIAFSPDGRTLASCSNDQTIRLWDVATGALLRECLGHSDWVMWVAFHPSGHTLASASFDGTVRQWDVATGQPIAPIGLSPMMRHSKGVVALAYHPKGHLLVSASWEERLKFWDAHTQALLHTLIAPGPYSGMNIANVTGMSEAQRAALRALGAVD